MSTKISTLPPSAGLVLTDIFPVVDDPGGVPVTQKADFSQLAALLGTGNFVLKSGDTMTGALVHPVGAVGTPSITFTGDLDTGVYHPAVNTVGLSAGGTLVLSAVTTGVNIAGALDVSTDLNVLNGTTTLSQGGSSFNSDGSIVFGFTGPFTMQGMDGAFDPATFFEFTYAGPSGLAEFNRSVFSMETGLTLKVIEIHAEDGTPSGAGQIAFFNSTPVSQQTAPGDTLAQVLTALRAYGLLAP